MTRNSGARGSSSEMFVLSRTRWSSASLFSRAIAFLIVDAREYASEFLHHVVCVVAVEFAQSLKVLGVTAERYGGSHFVVACVRLAVSLQVAPAQNVDILVSER